MNFIIKLIIILSPLIIGFATGKYCGVNDTSGESVSFRPPPWVFGVAWTILYLLIGISFYYSLNLSIIPKYLIVLSYIFLNLFLCLWVYFYSCKNMKKEAIYIIVSSLVFAIICCILSNSIIGQISLVPLIVWLFFATLLNIFEVEKLKN